MSKRVKGWSLMATFGLISGVVGLGWPPAEANKQKPVSEDQLVNDSDVIVTARVTEMISGGPNQVKLAVSRVWKGAPPAELTAWYVQIIDYPVGTEGVWCLKEKDGKYALWHHSGFQSADRLPSSLKARLEKLGGGSLPGVTTADLGFTWRSDKGRLIVAAIRTGSPAAAGKFQKEDVVTAVEGARVVRVSEFQEQVGKFGPGARLKVRVDRGETAVDGWLVLPAAASVAGPGVRVTAPDGRGYTIDVDIQQETSGPTNRMMFQGKPYTGPRTWRFDNGQRLEEEFVDGQTIRKIEYDRQGRKTTEFINEDGVGQNFTYYPSGRKKYLHILGKGRDEGFAWDEQGKEIPYPFRMRMPSLPGGIHGE